MSVPIRARLRLKWFGISCGGGAAINVLARHCGIESKIVDAGVMTEFDVDYLIV